MRTYHLAGLGIVLGIGALIASFGSGYFASAFGTAPTQMTEIILIGAILAGVALLIGALATEARDGRRGMSERGVVGRLRKNRLGGFHAGHVVWFAIAFIFAGLVGVAAASWASLDQGASSVSAGIVGFLVFLLLLVVMVIVFAAMGVSEGIKARRSR